MARPKQMVKRSEIEIAKRRRTCKFTGDPISAGEVSLVVYDGPRERSCYSQKVAIEMIRLARLRLDELERELT